MGRYVEPGYVETGYIEGDGFVAPDAGQHPLKFFVSNGSKTIEELTSSIAAMLADGEMAVIYVPEAGKILIGTNAGFGEFLGGVDIGKLLMDQRFIDKVEELTSLEASIIAPDGSIVSNATVTQVDEVTFDVALPDNFVGSSFKIRLSQTNAGG